MRKWKTAKANQMPKEPKNRRANVLRKYEATNLLFFLAFVLALGALVSWVFNSYRTRNDRPASTIPGIISERTSPASEACLYYLGTKLSEAKHVYRSRAEIPISDDGLLAELFAIPGVAEVVIDRKLVIIQKFPSIPWEKIQPGVRQVLENHLHPHP